MKIWNILSIKIYHINCLVKNWGSHHYPFQKIKYCEQVALSTAIPWPTSPSRTWASPIKVTEGPLRRHCVSASLVPWATVLKLRQWELDCVCAHVSHIHLIITVMCNSLRDTRLLQPLALSVSKPWQPLMESVVGNPWSRLREAGALLITFVVKMIEDKTALV